MKIYSKTLTKLISNIDIELETLENQISNKNFEICELKETISNLQQQEIDRIGKTLHDMFKHTFSDKINVDGLGVSGVKLLLELRKFEQITSVEDFLTNLGL